MQFSCSKVLLKYQLLGSDFNKTLDQIFLSDRCYPEDLIITNIRESEHYCYDNSDDVCLINY